MSYDRALQVLPDATDEQALKTPCVSTRRPRRGSPEARTLASSTAANSKASLAYIEKVEADLPCCCASQLGSGRVAAAEQER